MTYVLGYYTGGNEYFFRGGPDTDFADVTLLSGRYQVGDQFPSLDPELVDWAVDMRYVVGEVFMPVALTPTNSGNFTGGRWSGQVAVRGAGTDLALRALDAGGRSGASALFDVFAAVDADGDGMWDGWEARYHLQPNDASDAELDGDGDGHSSLQEFLAGTDPGRASSVTRISSVGITNGVRITVEGARGRSFVLERRDHPTESWQAVVSFRIDSALAPEGTVDVVDPLPPPAPVHLYRVRVVPR
jgi:hypothetical protein